MRDLVPALIFAIAAAAIGVAQPMAAPRSGEMAVAFPPFTSEAEAWRMVREAGGHVVGPTRLPNIVVVYAGDLSFQERARGLGALLFLSAKGLCAPISSPEAI